MLIFEEPKNEPKPLKFAEKERLEPELTDEQLEAAKPEAAEVVHQRKRPTMRSDLEAQKSSKFLVAPSSDTKRSLSVIDQVVIIAGLSLLVIAIATFLGGSIHDKAAEIAHQISEQNASEDSSGVLPLEP